MDSVLLKVFDSLGGSEEGFVSLLSQNKDKNIVESSFASLVSNEEDCTFDLFKEDVNFSSLLEGPSCNEDAIGFVRLAENLTLCEKSDDADLSEGIALSELDLSSKILDIKDKINSSDVDNKELSLDSEVLLLDALIIYPAYNIEVKETQFSLENNNILNPEEIIDIGVLSLNESCQTILGRYNSLSLDSQDIDIKDNNGSDLDPDIKLFDITLKEIFVSGYNVILPNSNQESGFQASEINLVASEISPFVEKDISDISNIVINKEFKVGRESKIGQEFKSGQESKIGQEFKAAQESKIGQEFKASQEFYNINLQSIVNPLLDENKSLLKGTYVFNDNLKSEFEGIIDIINNPTSLSNRSVSGVLSGDFLNKDVIDLSLQSYLSSLTNDDSIKGTDIVATLDSDDLGIPNELAFSNKGPIRDQLLSSKQMLSLKLGQADSDMFPSDYQIDFVKDATLYSKMENFTPLNTPLNISSLDSPEDIKSIISQMNFGISSIKDNKEKVLSIKLAPEELGRVEISLEVADDGDTKAVIMVENKDTLRLLQKESEALRVILQSTLKNDQSNLNFAFQDRNDRQWQQDFNSDDVLADSFEDYKVLEDITNERVNEEFNTSNLKKVDIKI